MQGCETNSTRLMLWEHMGKQRLWEIRQVESYNAANSRSLALLNLGCNRHGELCSSPMETDRMALI